VPGTSSTSVTGSIGVLAGQRWLEADQPQALKKFAGANAHNMAEDHHGLPVFLARSDWHVTCATQDWPDVRFLKTREQIQ